MITLFLFVFLINLFPSSSDMIVGLIAFIGVVLFGGVQWLFCAKARTLAVRLIPVYYVILDLLLCLFFAVFGSVDFFLDFTSAFALIGVACDLVIAFGIGVVWIIYGVRSRSKKSA